MNRIHASCKLAFWWEVLTVPRPKRTDGVPQRRHKRSAPLRLRATASPNPRRCARGDADLRCAPMPPRSEARSGAAIDDGVPLAARRAVTDGDIEAGATQARAAAEAYKARRCAAEACCDAADASSPARSGGAYACALGVRYPELSSCVRT